MKELITSMVDIPQFVRDSLTETESHILSILFEKKLSFHCMMSLSGYMIKPKNFVYEIPFDQSLYRRHEFVTVVQGETFKKTLKNFISAICSRETKHHTIYLKSTERKHNYSENDFQHAKDSYWVIILREWRIDHVNDIQAQEIIESLRLQNQAIVNHALQTTPSY